MRKAGILLAVSSLPSKYGIGDFGYEAIRFLNDCKDSRMKIWQILPLNPLGYGNSPYQPYSSKAMDDLYISLDLLYEDGLLKERPEKFNSTNSNVDYEAVREYKNEYLKKAFKKFETDDEYEEFIKREWVYNYAMFICFKNENELRQWTTWPKKQIEWIDQKKPALKKYEKAMNFEMFKQFILYKQWMRIKNYANSLGIEIMGDIPFYVGIDSLDVYQNKEAFLLDDQYEPEFIAGVPPDYFSADGQRWGNPIYDWEYLKANDYEFWVDRISYNTELFDIIRIDHFRAFDTYWQIPASSPTAAVGEWLEAPGYEVFDAIYKACPDIKLVAEDLGDLTPGVGELRDHYGFKGMQILQFEFDPLENNNNQKTKKNSIVYTGTHDNATILGWYNSQSRKTQREVMKILKSMNYEYKDFVDMFLEYVLSTVADYAILPMQDILKLDDTARMNNPGTVGYPNWAWKMTDFRYFESRINLIRRLMKKHRR